MSADNQVKEAVNHPQHYQSSKMEVIEVIEAFDLGFCLGNTVKYVLRAGKKDSLKTVEDLKKAIWYLNREIESRESGLALKEDSLPQNPQNEESKLISLIREARSYILEAKSKFYPNTTNSFVDTWLEKTKDI